MSQTKIYTGIATGSSIVSLEESKFDLFGTRTAFDNLINLIKSKTTIEEVGLRLFTEHMMLDEAKPDAILRSHYSDLMKIVPDEVKQLVVKGNFDKTYQNFIEYKDKDHTNFIYELINLNHRHYSTKKILSKIKVSRVQSSDMIEIRYDSDDPGICSGTLRILNEVFVKVYSQIKVNQSDAVVRYFEKEIEFAKFSLNNAEEELVSFNRTHNIINYYEQTKHIASEKEHFDLMYTEILMNHVASESVLVVLENKMSESEKRRINSDKMLALRDSLAKINYQISMKVSRSEIFGELTDEENNRLNTLRNKAGQLTENLRKNVETQFNLDNSIEGFTGNSILEQWLQKMIEFESSRAQLEVGKQINQEFEELFEKFAPLGATMKRLERKIDVAERKYLSMLNSLNTAKLKQQNIELNSNLKIVAEPFFPIIAEPSKRKFLVAIAFMIGGIIPAFIILALEFMDSSIKTIRRAEDKTGLKVAAMFPKNLNKKDKLDHDFINGRSLDVIARRISLLNPEKKNGVPHKIMVYSNLKGEGKTYLSGLLFEKFYQFGLKTLFVTPDEVEPIPGCINMNYNITPNFNQLERIEDVIDKSIDINEFDYVFVEVPSIITNAYPLKWFKEVDNSLLVLRANRAWTEADSNALKDIETIREGKQSQIILNGVELTEMESILGDLPKKRSWFRRGIKNVLRLRFFTNANIL
ncbi:GumC family protein [Marinifilum flexuosum]|uniref:GumC family protein n=1 Tax=Marinifilum flexuosum TaxID=1117708 RepID=UPI002490875A|nr:hypothetical protein [Marinifilum flexuosum]